MTWKQRVEQELARLDALGLRRTVRPRTATGRMLLSGQQRPLVNFASNDYLGLAQSPELEEALVTGAR